MSAAPEYAVIVRFNHGSTDLGRRSQQEDQLRKAIDESGTGQFDGNEVAVDGSFGTLNRYGPDADCLFETVAPVLQFSAFMRDATVIRRCGPPGNGANVTGPVAG